MTHPMRVPLAATLVVAALTGGGCSLLAGEDTCSDYLKYSADKKAKAVANLYEGHDDTFVGDDPAARQLSLDGYCSLHPDDKLSELEPI